MRDRQLFCRVRRAVRSVETGTPFARGNGQFARGEEMGGTHVHLESPVVEGIARRWRLHEEHLSMCGNGDERTPFEETNESLWLAKIQPESRRTLPEIGQIGMRRSRRMEEDMFEWSPKVRRRNMNFVRMGMKGEKNSRGCHNFGRKPRASSRETIRNMRTLSHEERLLAGDALREENEARKARRNARVCKRTIVARLPSPEFTLGAERKAA